VSIWLLGAVASLAIPASTATLRAVPVVGAVQTYDAAIPVAASQLRLHIADPASLRLALTTPDGSVSPESARRKFVEDTPPPSADALSAVRLLAPLEPDALPPPASSAPKRNSGSVSNRQRAP